MDMATLTIRKLDDGVYERLRAQAQRNDRSIEAEARQVLGGALREETTEIVDEAERREWVAALIERLNGLHARIPDNPEAPDSVALIRAIRDEE